MDMLEVFIRGFCPEENILQVAASIPARVIKARASVHGLELELNLQGEEFSGEGLILLEDLLRRKLDLSHIRFYLKNLPASEHGQRIDFLLPWIVSCLKKENALYCGILSSCKLREENSGIKGSLKLSVDAALKDALTQSFRSFVQRYLYADIPFTWEEEEIDSRVVLEQLERQYREKLMMEAAAVGAEDARKTGNSNKQMLPKENTETMRSEKKKGTGRVTTLSSENNSYNPGNSAGGIPDAGSWVSKAKAVTADSKKSFKRKAKEEGVFWGRYDKSLPSILLSEANSETGTTLFAGAVELEESRLTKAGDKVIVNYFVTDDTASISATSYMKPEEADAFETKFKKGGYASFSGNIYFDDRFSRDLKATVTGIYPIAPPSQRIDEAPVKRVELHCHSKMSDKDASTEASRIMTESFRMGHSACAITDHGVVQGFPDVADACRKIQKNDDQRPFKAIYGMEGYLVDDGPCIAFGDEEDDTFVDGFVSIAIKTSGPDCKKDRIQEISAGLYEKTEQDGYRESDSFFLYVDEGDSGEWEAVKKLSFFIGEKPVCGHKIFFTLSFLRQIGFSADVENKKEYRVKFLQTAVDIRELIRVFYPETDCENLVGAAARMELETPVSDLQSEDRIAGAVLSHFLKEQMISSPAELNRKAGRQDIKEILGHKNRPNHIVFLAADALGLFHMYHMVSASHTKYFHSRPRIPRSLLTYFRTGILIGGACERGEIFQAVYQLYIKENAQYDRTRAALLRDEKLIRKAKYYDYMEIQPLCNNGFYLRNPESGLKTNEDLVNINRLIIDLGDTADVLTCATTDAHFFEKKEGEYRKYLLRDMGYKDWDEQADLYFRTTQEMLDEFSWLGEQRAFEVVVENTNRIADLIEPGIKPFPEGTYPPVIDTAADDVKNITWNMAKELYEHEGQIHPEVKARVEKELESIIGNGFAIMYYIAYRLVKKSNEDGYVVGSRGSVGSSLVATLCGISEVNPLEPHHRCPSCRYTIFSGSGSYGSGYDLPAMDCPQCNFPMIRDGQDIPFETFLGFFGDKQPDIDLNFSGKYQPQAHKYVEELFGKSHTFRAGTISAYAEKNAIAVVRKIAEETGEAISRAELRRRSLGLIGIKRTTGQHPGGIVVVPKEMDVNEFTPVQHPANKKDSGVITTHFDFNAMHDTIFKLDILGHFDPTMLRMLSDLTGVDVRTIPIPDEKVMSLFVSTEALGLPDGESGAGTAVLGLPEMGTFMARDMIKETRPSSFYDLVQLMGLSHGTDVWKGNAQELIRDGTCALDGVIGCRDGIMTRLIYWGLPNKDAFDIMEKVRKGKGLSSEQETLMREKGVPEWYISSCKKIKYMFPKAHAAAYAISSLRIAWFKVYYPEEYYCTYFTIRGDEFDGDAMCHGQEKVKSRASELYNNFNRRTSTEKSEYYLCELVEEMYQRGITFLPYDLEKSAGDIFLKTGDKKILPPFSSIPSISKAMGNAIAKEREENGPFRTREELAKRCGLGTVAMEKLAASGCISHLPESRQMDLFSMLNL